MARFKDFTATPTLLPADLNTLQDEYEYALSAWQDLPCSLQRTGLQNSTGTALRTATTSEFDQDGVIYVDSADSPAAAPRVVRYRLRALICTNAVAPACTITVGLAPVTIARAASGAANTYSAGAFVTGSTVVFTTPAASQAQIVQVSSSFAAPTAGLYMLAVSCDVAIAVNARVELAAHLQARRV